MDWLRERLLWAAVLLPLAGTLAACGEGGETADDAAEDAGDAAEDAGDAAEDATD
jgi:predicted small lipoprotein YifL